MKSAVCNLLKKQVVLSLLSIFVGSWCYGASQAQIDELRERALAHIFSQQDSDGYWGGGEVSNIQTTANVLRSAHYAGLNKGLHLSRGISWLVNSHPTNNFALGLKAGVSGLYGYEVDEDLAELASNVNGRDPVWGTYIGYQPSFPDTAVALDAWYLSDSNYSSSGTAITFLRSSQNSDGGWPYHARTLVGAVSGLSNVIPTAYSVIVQSHYILGGQGSQTDIGEGVNWLLAQQLADGSFSDDASATIGEIYETSLVIRAINEAAASGNSAATAVATTAALDQAIDFLYDNSILFGAWQVEDVVAAAAIVESLPVTTLADTDGDGLPDSIEPLLGTDLLVADAESISSGLGDSLAGVTVGGEFNAPGEVGEELRAYIPLGSGSPTSYSIGGGLPVGLAFDGSTGTITGSPQESGTFNIAFQRHYNDGTSDQGILTLNITGGVAVPILPAALFIVLVVMLIVIQRHRKVVTLLTAIAPVVLITVFMISNKASAAKVSMSDAKTIDEQSAEIPQGRAVMPEQTVKVITDQFVGEPAKRNETVRSIGEHVNAIAIAMREDNSIEARKMFAIAHRNALEALNKRLNEELSAKRLNIYSEQNRKSIILTKEQIENKDNSLSALFSEVDNLLSLEGEKALNAFLSIKEKIDKSRGLRYSTYPVPTWKQVVDAGDALAIPESEQIPGYVKANNRDWAQKALAFNGNGVLLAQAPSTATQALSCSYAAADLADDGIDVELTSEMQEKAKELDYSPIKIYDFVSNEIDFEVYYGALKGAHATLMSESGGATDQASLLIALLRASNIPARYVRGEIEAHIGSSSEEESRIARWLQSGSLLVAANRMARYGNPSAAYAPNSFLRFAHVWVEACVPYAHYHGASVDLAGHRWVPLDPSYEVRSFKNSLSTNVSFDFDAYLDGFKELMPEELLEQEVNDGITDPDKDFNDVGYRSIKETVEVDILPASLPYHVRQFTDWSNSGAPETSVLPDSHRYMLTVEATNSSGASLGASLTVPMQRVAIHRMTLYYRGQTTSHENAMQDWRLDGGSLPTNLDLIPVLRINGVDQSVGTASVKSSTTNNGLNTRVTMDEYRYSTSNKGNCPGVSGTNLVNDACFDTIRAANYHSVQAWPFTGTPKVLASLAKDVIREVNEETNIANDIDETLGRFLHFMSLGYMADISNAAKRIGVMTGNTGDVGIHLGITGSQSSVDKVLDLPFGILKTGFYVDVPGGLALSQNVVDASSDADAFLATGYAASAYESFIWQEYARLDAVSTIRGIQFAKQNGHDVLTINSSNQATETPKLIAVENGDSGAAAYPSGFIANVLEDQYLDNGFEIKIPDRRINYQGWEGYTLVGLKDDAQGMSATFPIAGDYAGGYTVSDPIDWSYDPFYDTGYIGGNTGSILNGTVTGSTPPPSTVDNTAVYQIDYGAQGGGVNHNTTLAGDPVNVVNGNFYHSETDISIPHRDLPIVFERVYNSREPMDTGLGYGWTHSFNHKLVFVDEVPDNEETSADTDGKTSSVVWANGTGGETRIEVANAASGGVTSSSTFTNREGQYFSFVRRSDSTFFIKEKNGLQLNFSATAGDVGHTARLTSIVSRNGNTISLSYASNELDRVTDGTGRYLEFTYSNGRISRVEDWAGRAHEYEYDGNGNLVTYKNPLVLAGKQNPVTYDYFTDADSPSIDHAIKSITLPKGNGMDFEYYIDGRVFRHTNTAGETFTFQYNDFRRETIVTDARGFEKQYFFDEHGNAVRIVDEEGGVATYEYGDPDDPYLRTAVVNEARLRTEYEYNDQATLTLQRNPSGSTVEYSFFTAFQQPEKIKDANGNYRFLKYDADGNVTDEIALRASVVSSLDPASYTPNENDILSWTKHSYDNVGNLESTTQIRDVAAIEGFSQTWIFDSNQLYATELQRCGDKNGDGTIDAVNDPCDIASLEYDSLGRLTSGVNARFEQVEFRYDELNRIVRGSDSVGQIRDYGYDDNGNQDSEKLYGQVLGGAFLGIPIDDSPESRSNSYVHDSSSSMYDDSDRMHVSLDSGGNATYYSYDAMGNVESVTNPDNYTIGFNYDGLGRVVSAIDEEGREARRDIDPIGRMRRLTDPNGNSETFSYYGSANDGRLEKQCEAPASSTDNPRCTTFIYDDNGNVTGITDNAGSITQTYYDALNRAVRIVEPVYADPVHGQVRPVTRYTYDLLGNVTTVKAGYTDVLGLATNDVLQTQQSTNFDDWRRAIEVTDPLGEVWRYTYNQSGDVLSETKPYITLTSALGSDDLTPVTINNTYQYGGLITSQGGISYKYNPLGQVVSVTGRAITSGSSEDTSTYFNSYTYSYDEANRLKRESGGGVSFNYTTTPGGLLEKVEVVRGSAKDVINYSYDQTGRLKSISANESEQVEYVFDDGGRLRSKLYPGDVKASYDYFNDDRLKELLVTGSSTLLQQSLTYDNLGRRDGLTESLNGVSKTSSYGYDALSRLTSETLGGQTQSFTYDEFGNRITHSKFDGSTNYYEYDAAQQLKSIRDTNSTGNIKARYQYTPAGSLYRSCEGDSANNVSSELMIRGECDLRDYLFFRTNPYGQVDQVGSYDEPGTQPVTHEVFIASSNSDEFPELTQTLNRFYYDYSGRRMERSSRDLKGLERLDPDGDGTYNFTWTEGLDGTFNPTNTQYRYMGESIYLSYNSGMSVASPDARWLPGARVDEPLIRYGNDGSITNYHQDARNSAVLTTNTQTGAVVASQQFDAFGEVNQSSSVIPQYGYTGREPSVEGLMYYRARYYDPSSGRFTQRDPKGFIDGINRYAYVRNNPINNIDPRGTLSVGTNNYGYLGDSYYDNAATSSQTLFGTSGAIDADATQQLTSSVGGDTSFLENFTNSITQGIVDTYNNGLLGVGAGFSAVTGIGFDVNVQLFAGKGGDDLTDFGIAVTLGTGGGYNVSADVNLNATFGGGYEVLNGSATNINVSTPVASGTVTHIPGGGGALTVGIGPGQPGASVTESRTFVISRERAVDALVDLACNITGNC